MREVIMTGKTVEEATERALAELGAGAEEAGIEVLELPQRRLFKSIPAKVRVYVEDEEPAQEKPEPPKHPAPKAPKEPKAPREHKEVKPAAPEPPKPEKPQQPKQPAPSEPERPEPHQEAQPAPAPQEPAEEPVDLAQNTKARDAVEYLTEVCAKMGAQDITITPVKRGEATILKVEGESAGTLIGHRGEVMEALNYLTSLVANRSGGDYMKLSLDINHYRSKREANLTALARRIGAKVARTGRSHTFEPMNPYERRIIHSAISEMEGVKSESIGEGADRRVVVSSTDPNARPPRENRGRGGRGGRSSGRGRGGRKDGDRGPRSSTPGREFADRPRDPGAAPVVPKRTETINDGADLPLYGKIEL